MADLRLQNSLLSSADFQTLKGQLIADVGAVPKTKIGDKSFEVVSQNAVKGGVEVFVRAWHPDGSPIGFGEDGSVEIERFRFFNPPTLVPDPNGDVISTSDIEVDDGNGNSVMRTFQTRYRSDPKAALLRIISHALSVKKQIHKGTKIVSGKIGNTTDSYASAEGANSPCDGIINGLSGGGTYQQNWDAMHNNTDGSLISGTRVTVGDEAIRNRKDSGNYSYLSRAVFSFNTANIADTDSITSATVSFTSNYGYNWGQDSATDPRSYYGLVGCTGLASTSNLTGTDFGLVGDAIDNPTLLSDTKPFYDAWATATVYVDFPMNAAGKAWINKTGVTSLGLREGHDIEDVILPIVENNYVTFAFVETAGTTNDPVLVVEHGAGAAPQNSGFFQVF